MFRKKRQTGFNEDIAMKIITDGKIRDVTYQELLLSANLTLEGLISVLVQKNIITPDELLEAIDGIRKKSEAQSDETMSGMGNK